MDTHDFQEDPVKSMQDSPGHLIEQFLFYIVFITSVLLVNLPGYIFSFFFSI